MSAIPFTHTSGLHDAKLVLLGEYWSETDERYDGRPFCGQSGRELFRMLADAWSAPAAREAAALRSDEDWLAAREAWLQREGILLTNVFALRPPRNDLGAICAMKGELDADYNLPALRTENPRYVRRELALPQLRRLSAELSASPRNLILCLGSTALWSLTGSAAIGTLRGATGEGGVLAAEERRRGTGGERDDRYAGRVDLAAQRRAGAAGGVSDTRAAEWSRADQPQRGVDVCAGGETPQLSGGLGQVGLRSESGQGGEAEVESAAGPARLKFLPTYSPAAVLRAWHWRPIVLADLLKAARERRVATLARPHRRVIVSPSIGEVEEWTGRALSGPAPARLLAPDIETLNGQIRCIGFARSREDVLVIPFIARLTGGSYWGDEAHELRAWRAVRALLESPIPKVGQNFLFDLTYLSRFGIRSRNCYHDTMLLHHTLFPEMQKGLGFLGSIYTNESAWKLFRRRGTEKLKRDE